MLVGWQSCEDCYLWDCHQTAPHVAQSSVERDFEHCLLRQPGIIISKMDVMFGVCFRQQVMARWKEEEDLLVNILKVTPSRSRKRISSRHPLRSVDTDKCVMTTVNCRPLAPCLPHRRINQNCNWSLREEEKVSNKISIFRSSVISSLEEWIGLPQKLKFRWNWGHEMPGGCTSVHTQSERWVRESGQ